MGKKFILLIDDEQAGTVCWKGEGTVEQVKEDIKNLIKKGVSLHELEVIPVVGTRLHPANIILTVLGFGLLSFGVYENLHKRIRKGRGKRSST